MKYVLVIFHLWFQMHFLLSCVSRDADVCGWHKPGYMANRLTVGLGQWEARGDTDCHIYFLLPSCCGPHPWHWLRFSRNTVPGESPGPYCTLLTLLHFIPFGPGSDKGFRCLLVSGTYIPNLSFLPCPQLSMSPSSESPLESRWDPTFSSF